VGAQLEAINAELARLRRSSEPGDVPPGRPT
jgi:hypothetical protein